jgi:hypothetical protein
MKICMKAFSEAERVPVRDVILLPETESADEGFGFFCAFAKECCCV